MSVLSRFPAVKSVALVVAYSNGMINRSRTEAEWLDSTDEVFGAEGVYENELQELELYCSRLTPDEIVTVADGDQDEASAIAGRFPQGVKLFKIFDDLMNIA